MQDNLISFTDKDLWEKSFRFGKVRIRVAMHKTSGSSSFLLEKYKNTNGIIVIRQQVFQKINNGVRIRLARHSRTQILKKV